jgi:acid phosphatase type 7
VAQGSTGYGTSGSADGWTAALITRYGPDGVLGLGDLQYEQGSLSQYQTGWGRNTCTAPDKCDAWGKHLSTVYPAPGNHEWLTSNAQGYRDYFAARLGAIGSDTPTPAGATYYSFDLGSWHFVSLDSDVSLSSTGAQVSWLRTDLAANNGRPTLVYYHHPTWSSGEHGSTGGQGALTTVLVGDIDVQVVLNGHDHDYERFAPMGTSGPAAGGVRYFVVGTGGKSHYCANSAEVGSQVFNCDTYGLLGLTLSPTGYSWVFHPVSEVGGSGSFTDSGSSGLR